MMGNQMVIGIVVDLIDIVIPVMLIPLLKGIRD